MEIKGQAVDVFYLMTAFICNVIIR